MASLVYRHVERSNGAVRTACDSETDGGQKASRPKMMSKKLTENDCHEWKLIR